ncbi:38k protein [Lambdina fiscellaria nucleopolyhedrovirus]|uniref:38k protein n=1 Tax=Lambdina fiscellaria nucleopolyhedrovirus TaxID=1642929 RepID=A0A0E3URB0_9ABAC|nr:38k protein [Lambdina fiscellaria nucleopolyhedrovirus]AKC91680.1 38k protein [Lambdina fiscellaria nucleopolyhedrovirus]
MKQVVGVYKIKSFIFNVGRKVSHQKINQLLVIVAFAKTFENNKQIVTMHSDDGVGRATVANAVNGDFALRNNVYGNSNSSGGGGTVVDSGNAKASSFSTSRCAWIVLRLKRPFVRHHWLVLMQRVDMRRLMFDHTDLFEFVVFKFEPDAVKHIDFETYQMQVIKCADRMDHLRHAIKLAYGTCVFGHTYVINERIPMYAFLKEWYVQNYLEVYQAKQQTFAWEAPHALVFDLDSTLITNERDVRIRDYDVYDSLLDFKRRGCVLLLWSYGSRDHVVHSLNVTNLTNFFDIIICEGQNESGMLLTRKIIDERNYKNNDDDDDKIDDNDDNEKRIGHVFVKKSFYIDLNDDDDNNNRNNCNVSLPLPKSPKIALWYLRKKGVNCLKSITLVDDLNSNNYAYDYFLNVKKCTKPLADWRHYHQQIVNNLESHDANYTKFKC